MVEARGLRMALNAHIHTLPALRVLAPAEAVVERTTSGVLVRIAGVGDSLTAGYSAWVLREDWSGLGTAPVMGYFLLMAAVDEAHLLNISVASEYQGRGLGLALLHKATETARAHRARSMILEVRPSNQRAIEVYERYGFRLIGRRVGYYPISTENRTDREDALVMHLDL